MIKHKKNCMEILFTSHARERLKERGATEEEVLDIIQSGKELIGQKGRFVKSKTYTFEKVRNKKFYPEKRVEVIYTIEHDKIIVITVYVFYGKWSNI